jgi:hypothetical protein
MSPGMILRGMLTVRRRRSADRRRASPAGTAAVLS